MAKVDKKRMVGGLPSKEQILLSKGNTDRVPAMIQTPQGLPQGPASLTEGEIVFSIPAIIAAGDGDYDAGAKALLDLHDQLKAMGEGMMGGGQGEID